MKETVAGLLSKIDELEQVIETNNIRELIYDSIAYIDSRIKKRAADLPSSLPSDTRQALESAQEQNYPGILGELVECYLAGFYLMKLAEIIANDQDIVTCHNIEVAALASSLLTCVNKLDILFDPSLCEKGEELREVNFSSFFEIIPNIIENFKLQRNSVFADQSIQPVINKLGEFNQYFERLHALFEESFDLTSDEYRDVLGYFNLGHPGRLHKAVVPS